MPCGRGSAALYRQVVDLKTRKNCTEAPKISGLLMPFSAFKSHRIMVLRFQPVLGIFFDDKEVIKQSLKKLYYQKKDRIHRMFNLSLL